MRAALAAYMFIAGCVHALPPTMQPAEVLHATTDDGWRLPVRHYPGEGVPVLLVHGMSANHYNFDFRPEVSLAAWLQDAGWDVWVAELRGDPGGVPPEGARRGDITFDDLAEHDLPAIVDHVLRATGEPRLLWVGHSMGGMLLYTALETYPDKLLGGVAISSPATFEHGLRIYKTAAGARFLVAGRGVLPTRGLGRLFAGLGLAGALEERLASRDSVSPELLKGMAMHVLWPVPNATARQAIGWIRGRSLQRVDGTPWVQPGGVDVPLLVMAGPHDGIVAEADVARACDMFTQCTWLRLGTADGFSHDYGHVDPVVGRTAQLEVYPRVHRFLRDVVAASGTNDPDPDLPPTTVPPAAPPLVASPPVDVAGTLSGPPSVAP